MKSYFGMETFGIRHYEPLISVDNQRALNILIDTTKQNGERFESGLLWRKDFKSFADSYEMALKMLMFHQVSIIPEDQYALRFIWRNGNTFQPPKTYVMQRMIFGAACSPTTAQFVKNRSAGDFIKDYPRAVAGIIEKRYFDDYVDCFDSEKEAIEVFNAVKRIHEAGGCGAKEFSMYFK